VAARWPSAILGALGCTAVFGLGVMAHGRLAGVTAALLLMANPVYRMHARRAMCDVPTEALVLMTAAAAICSWRRMLRGPCSFARWVAAAGLVGLLAGLAALAKLNGLLSLMIVAALAGLALALRLRTPRRGSGAVAGAALLSAWVGALTFVILNPFATADPSPPLAGETARLAASGLAGRLIALVEHRRRLSRQMQVWFPRDALPSLDAKIHAILTRGFGRYGALGPSAVATAAGAGPSVDRRAWVWGPWVLAGAAGATLWGRRQVREGEPPTAWAVLLAAAVAFATIAAYLPMAWDRYFLPIQSWSALLAGCAAAEAAPRLVLALRAATVGLRRRPAMFAAACYVLLMIALADILRPAPLAEPPEVFVSDLP